MKLRYLWCVVILVLVGCGRISVLQTEDRDGSAPSGGNGGVSQALSLRGAPYVVLRDQGLNRLENEIRGDGDVVFLAPARAVDRNFALEFSIDVGGSVTLATHASAQLDEGIETEFENRDGRIVGSISIAGREYPMPAFNALGLSGPVGLSVDIHVHGSEGHVIVFVNHEKMSFDYQGEVVGKFWGLKLRGATVSFAADGNPKVVH